MGAVGHIFLFDFISLAFIFDARSVLAVSVLLKYVLRLLELHFELCGRRCNLVLDVSAGIPVFEYLEFKSRLKVYSPGYEIGEWIEMVGREKLSIKLYGGCCYLRNPLILLGSVVIMGWLIQRTCVWITTTTNGLNIMILIMKIIIILTVLGLGEAFHLSHTHCQHSTYRSVCRCYVWDNSVNCFILQCNIRMPLYCFVTVK